MAVIGAAQPVPRVDAAALGSSGGFLGRLPLA